MFAAVDWDSFTVAGAFILGAVFAAVATIRIMRAVVLLLSRRDRHDKPS